MRLYGNTSKTLRWRREQALSATQRGKTLNVVAARQQLTPVSQLTRLRSICVALIASGLAACAVTVQESKRTAAADQPSDQVVLLWAQPRTPDFGYTPALGAALVGTPRSTFMANLDSEYLAFGESLTRELPLASWPVDGTVVVLPAKARQAQIDDAIKATSSSAAVVLLAPESVTAYCTAGCYSFNIRVKFLSAGSRRTLWTGLLSVPPKVAHRDSFDPRALDFQHTLRDELLRQRLLGTLQDEMPPADISFSNQIARPSWEHRKQVPASSGFAQASDVDSVPIRPDGKARYRYYLGLPAPKVFVVYASGGWRFFYRDADAMTHALDRCQRDGTTCWLYAVDDRVVWEPSVEKRIGRSDQLLDR